jgi:hypothetical protein
LSGVRVARVAWRGTIRLAFVRSVLDPEPRCVMGKGNNSQGKEKKKPKKGAKPAPVKTPPPPKK